MPSPKLPLFDVLAAINPDGRARRTNVLHHKAFKTLNDHFHDHHKWRWLVATDHGSTVVRIIDLWQTEMDDTFPYVRPWFLQPQFDTLDQAIGYIALNLC